MMEPTTDREIMIRLDSNVSQLRDSIERFAVALEKLEETKIKDHETRIMKIEKWQSEWAGAYKILTIAAISLSLFATLKAFTK